MLRRALAALCLSLLATPVLAADPPKADSSTLSTVRARGSVACGVQNDNPPFSMVDSQGVWRGLDVDSCRAIAAATLGDPNRIAVRPVTGLTRFPALQSGEIDVLFGSTTWTTTRETALGLVFAGPTYYSGQGFLVHAKLGVKSVKELDGASVCVPPGSTTELIMQDWARKNGVTFRPVVIDDPNQIQTTFLSGRCDAFTRDLTGLSGFRARQAHPEAFVLLPEFISMEPLGPFIRKGDDRWLDVVRWTQFALVAAEQMGVTAANAESKKTESNPDIRRLLGTEGDVGPSMGLEKTWALRAIEAVGNYGEMWERDVKPMGLERGNNRLWDQGGLMYAPPLR